jgi:hypothetical protein
MEYSTIFNTYTVDDIDFYNITRKIVLPDCHSSDLYELYTIPYTMPWNLLSYMVYESIDYYWIFQASNPDKKLNPMMAEASDKIFIIKPEYLNDVLEAIGEAEK